MILVGEGVDKRGGVWGVVGKNAEGEIDEGDRIVGDGIVLGIGDGAAGVGVGDGVVAKRTQVGAFHTPLVQVAMLDATKPSWHANTCVCPLLVWAPLPPNGKMLVV
tara:strand:- start:1371 stop:1688 length:318 start_codon:yes stop_codon:yes gene_type:complete